MPHFTLQRFSKGHPFYTDAVIENTDVHKGVVGKFQSTFGQWIDESGKFICYNLERRDTLTPEGAYSYTFYNSPANKCIVPLFENIPHFSYVEIHKANWAYQLKACSAPCVQINLAVPMGVASGAAWDKIMALMNNQTGTITIETLKH